MGYSPTVADVLAAAMGIAETQSVTHNYLIRR